MISIFRMVRQCPASHALTIQRPSIHRSKPVAVSMPFATIVTISRGLTWESLCAVASATGHGLALRCAARPANQEIVE